MAKKDKQPSKRKGAPPNRTAKEIEQEIKDVAARAQAIEDTILDLNTDEQKELAIWVGGRIDKAETSDTWKEVKQRIMDIRSAYEKGVPRTDYKMENCHDYRGFEAAALADGMEARIIGVFTAAPIVKLEGRNQKGVANAPDAEKYLDYHHSVNLDLGGQLGKTISAYLTKEGHAVLYSPWKFQIDEKHIDLVEKQCYVKEGQELWVDVDSPLQVETAKANGFVPLEPEEYDIEERVRPEVIANHPDAEVFSALDYLNPPDSKPHVRPPWEAVGKYYTLDEVIRNEDDGKFYKGSAKKVRDYIKMTRDEEEKEVKSEKRDTSNPDLEYIDIEKTPLDGVIKVWHVWGLLKIPGKDTLVQAMCLYHRQSRTILQAKLHPYVGERPVMYHLRLIEVPWRFSGIGIMELAMPGEHANNDLMNYVLDNGLIESSLKIKYNRKRLPNGISPFEFAKGIGVERMADVEAFAYPNTRTIDIAVTNAIRANTERRTGIGDLQLGRESTVTGKQPPTARGVISIIREGDIRFNLLNFTMIANLMKWAEHEMMLFQQLIGRKTVIEVTDKDGHKLFPDGLTKRQIMGSFKYIPNTTAQGLIRELDAQINLTLYNLFMQNPLFQKSFSAMFNMTEDVQKSLGKKKSWLPPMDQFAAAAGIQQPTDFERSMSPDEREFAVQLEQMGVPKPEIQRQIEDLRRTQNMDKGPVGDPEPGDDDQEEGEEEAA